MELHQHSQAKPAHPVRRTSIENQGGSFPRLTSSASPAPVLLESILPNPKLKLLDQVREVMRLRHYSIRTERCYCDWIRRFVKFHAMTSRENLLPAESKIEEFLSNLAVNGNVTASTQNQAFNALLFLYREIVHHPLGDIDALRASRPARLPTVLTADEVKQVISVLSGSTQLVAKLLYGSGLRLLEALRLRVHDLDFEMKQLTVRDGKGAKDRFTVLPESLIPSLKEHLARVKLTHEEDLGHGFGLVYLPGALDRKYPGAPREWGWQYVFPARDLSKDPRTGITRRHHLDEATVQRNIKAAAVRVGLAKRVTSHTFRQNAEFREMPTCTP